ncbi:MAG: hypothetical protein A4E30_00184 [Methanomassiliicoccales archaeon PtaB.Bin215]|nr:MAG: hypothetical protein A4E30_00184 [Methanomassiliicoccales archaeon PtaB.Bin215]
MNPMLGGIRMPKVPPAATLPHAIPILYLAFFISGMATLPMVAAVAMLSPQIEAKPAHPKTVAMESPPFMVPNNR